MTPKNKPGSLLDSSGTSLAAFSPSTPTAPTSKPFGNDISQIQNWEPCVESSNRNVNTCFSQIQIQICALDYCKHMPSSNAKVHRWVWGTLPSSNTDTNTCNAPIQNKLLSQWKIQSSPGIRGAHAFLMVAINTRAIAGCFCYVIHWVLPMIRSVMATIVQPCKKAQGGRRHFSKYLGTNVKVVILPSKY